MSEVRLYADEDAGETAVVQGLRARGFDVVSCKGTTIAALSLFPTNAALSARRSGDWPPLSAA